jgi:glyoxylate reductase/D-3-phosphoglycerate dehydrogenase
VSVKVGYFMKANEGIYEVLRRNMPPDFELVTLSNGPIEESLPTLEFLIAGKVTSGMLAQAPKLRFIQAPGAGSDGIDLEAAAARGIPVATTTCGIADEVAELTFALMLAAARRVVELDRELRKGNWLMWDRRLVSRTITGRTLGIVGMGRIGREVAFRAQSFKMDIVYSDPQPNAEYFRLPLEELLASSDIVSLHVPLNATTRRLIDRKQIARMKPGAILINTSRGEVVDEQALSEALLDGRLAGAGLDVFDPEPPLARSPLLKMDNVVLTPHVGTGTLDSTKLRARAYVRNIQRFVAGEEPDGLIAAGVEQHA